VHGDDHSGYPKTGESTDTSNNNNNKKNKRQTIKKYKPRTSEYRTIFGSEHSDEAKEHSGKGCTMIGNMRIPIVAGNLAIVMTKEAWTTTINHLVARAHLPKQLKSQKDEESPNLVNTTHYLHEVRFGQKQSNAGGASKVLTSNGYVHPLEHRLKIFENDFLGIGKEEIAVKLIPTLRSNPGLLSSLFGNGNRPFYQVSVVDHMIKPETMIAGSGGTAVPGIVLTYDVTPLAVHIDEDNGDGGFFGFLASLIGIVGGCFVTVGLFAGCAVSSVKAVAKKMD